MNISSLFKRKSSKTAVRIGVAVDVNGLLGVRVERPFSSRPMVSAAAHVEANGEDDWPAAFDALANQLDGRGLPVVLQVHEQLASLLQLALPNVPQEERASALKFRAREVSNIPIEDMIVDYIDVPGMRSRGSEPICYCALARRSQMVALRDAVKASRLVLEAIEVKELSLRHVLQRFSDKGENAALIFLGSLSSRLIIARDQLLYLFRSSNVQASQLERAESERLDTMLLDIQRTLDYYDSQFDDPSPKALYVAPNWPFMSFVEEWLTSGLHIPVRMLDLEDRIDGADKLLGLPADLALLALGAALRPREETG